ncbi:hypothetical protein B0H16DRAFT_1583243 [Mycena metata]|uniref:Transmembrane protein n=1 Tax=Mycena metata TaxID=1033252 RepID=A0AAD7I0U6_9AGAR|nr:hypothetical protein B0H16DRAFT_1583243 [Mycena metata]
MPPLNLQASTMAELERLSVQLADTVADQTTFGPSIRQTDTIQLMNANLNSLAIIATFLAAVQAQVLSSSLDKDDTNLQIATNALLFGGVFVNVLSGTIAIVGAIQLQRTHGLLKQRESSLTTLRDGLKNADRSSKEREHDEVALVHHLRVLEMVIFPLLHTPRLWNTHSTALTKSANLVEQIVRESDFDDSFQITAPYALSEYRHTTDRLAQSALLTSLGFTASLTVPWLVLAGLGCFTAGVACLVLDSQPVQVWATSFAVLGATALLLILVLVCTLGFNPRPVRRPFRDV